MRFPQSLLTAIFNSSLFLFLRQTFNELVGRALAPIAETQHHNLQKLQKLANNQAKIEKRLSTIMALCNKTPLIAPQKELENVFSGIIQQLAPACGINLSKYQSLIFYELLTLHQWPEQYWRFTKQLWELHELSKKVHREKTLPPNNINNDKQLQILYVCGLFPSIEHGGGLRLYDILTELVKKHKVDLYTHYNADLDEFTLNKIRNQLNSFQITDLAGINFNNLTNWLDSIGKAYKDYDVIQLEYPNSAELIASIKKAGGKHVGFTFMECVTKSSIIQINNCIQGDNLQHIKNVVKVFWYHLMAEKDALTYADFCIAMTPEDKKALESIAAIPIDIIPTCISTHEILDVYKVHKDKQYEENSVAFLGYFDHLPNIDAMIWYLQEIHPLVKKSIPKYKFFIIGRGDTTKLEEISKNDPNVIFTGRVNNIVPPLLQAKVCIAPLISGAGIRGKLNQYSIINRPTVTTSIGNKGIGYVHNESVLIADTAVDTAESIIRLLQDQEFYDKIKDNAQNYAHDNFTWPKQIDKLLQVYNTGPQ